VDDHAPGLKIRKIFLESFGYSVETAESGAAALKLLEKRPFDVVVLDYRMPQMTGLELAREIKQRFPALRLVVLSGCSVELPGELHTVVDGYVAKGSHPEILLQRLAEVLGAPPRRKRRSPSQNADLLAQTQHHLEESKRQVQRAETARAKRGAGGRRRTA
jgi:CheY-like chemotaxis protein